MTAAGVAGRIVGRVDRARLRLIALGMALILIVAAVVTMVLLLFTGTFSNYVPVSTELPSAGNAVSIGTPVIYRNVTIGQVATQGDLLPNGDVEVGLHIKPGQIGHVPNNVTATVAPSTIFGNEALLLNAPAHVSRVPLAKGDVIRSGATSTSIQNTVASLDYILTRIRPAQLDQALTAVAEALNGEGTGLGQTFSRTDTYLQQTVPDYPTAEADLALLIPVANTFTASTPDILGTISNLSSVSQNLTANETNFHQFLVELNQAAGGTNGLLSTSQTPLEDLLADFGPLLSALDQTPTEIQDILNGLDQWSKSWSTAESQGPYLSFASTVPIANATDLVLGATGAPNAASLVAQGLGTNLVNPPGYSAATDCPSYGSVQANCSGASASTASAIVTPPNEPNLQLDSATMPAAQEEQAISSLYAGINRGQGPDDPAVTTLLLSPLLHRAVGS